MSQVLNLKISSRCHGSSLLILLPMNATASVDPGPGTRAFDASGHHAEGENDETR